VESKKIRFIFYNFAMIYYDFSKIHPNKKKTIVIAAKQQFTVGKPSSEPF
jgi:hypothetical protein